MLCFLSSCPQYIQQSTFSYVQPTSSFFLECLLFSGRCLIFKMLSAPSPKRAGYAFIKTHLYKKDRGYGRHCEPSPLKYMPLCKKPWKCTIVTCNLQGLFLWKMFTKDHLLLLLSPACHHIRNGHCSVGQM